MDNGDGCVETSSKPETDPSRMHVLMEAEETVETADGVQDKMTEVGLADSDSVTTSGRRNSQQRGADCRRDGHRDNPVTDMVAVGVTRKRCDTL